MSRKVKESFSHTSLSKINPNKSLSMYICYLLDKMAKKNSHKDQQRSKYSISAQYLFNMIALYYSRQTFSVERQLVFPKHAFSAELTVFLKGFK